MSIAEPTALYQEHTAKVTSHEEIDRALEALAAGANRFAKTSVAERIRLVEACLDGLHQHAPAWVEAACDAKGLPPGNIYRAEEVAAGPLATARYLRLLLGVLRDIERDGRARLPGAVTVGADGRLRVQVMPARGVFDSLLFAGFKSYIKMQPHVTRDNLHEHTAAAYHAAPPEPGVALVLGAGNVSSIPPTDAFTKLFQDGKVVLLKMNPVNEYLGPHFAKCFAALVDAGYLRVVYGGAEAGAYAIGHDLVDEVHITGSVFAHDTIVWGPPGPDREARKAANDPLLKKPISSELGNVTPWICVPGPYSEKQLRFQAENLASMITNNASFNCVATKMIVTAGNWAQRARFLDLLEEVLVSVPRRKAYYPGAMDRFARFAGREPQDGEPGTLPFTLLRDVDPDEHPLYCNEESFVCVAAETAIDAATPEEFLDRATAFCNDRLWGTLGAGIMVESGMRKNAAFERSFQRAIDDLRYGTIGINHWPALSYAMMTPPWGGYPGATLHDTQSGIGWVHNVYMLDGIEKTVLEGPLTVSPKPFWFPTHRTAEQLGWKVVDLYHRPSMWKLPSLFASALRG